MRNVVLYCTIHVRGLLALGILIKSARILWENLRGQLGNIIENLLLHLPHRFIGDSSRSVLQSLAIVFVDTGNLYSGNVLRDRYWRWTIDDLPRDVVPHR